LEHVVEDLDVLGVDVVSVELLGNFASFGEGSLSDDYDVLGQLFLELSVLGDYD
jgi:hypothetical protein